MYYAYINEEGEVSRTVNPGSLSMIADRTTVDGYLVVHTGIKPGDLNKMYWDFETSTFVERDGKPNKHAKWKDKTWEVDTVSLMREFRLLRNGYLVRSDWTQLPDSPLTEIQKEIWRVYRQSLRDLPEAYPDLQSIDEVTWPTIPGE